MKANPIFLAALLGASGCADDSAETAVAASTSLPVGVDIAENMARFVFDSEPVFDDGLPAYGNDFITEGYLYPDGYLDENPGVNADGTPADPDAVIGTWSCRGFFVGNGAHTSSGPIVLTTQIFDLYESPGQPPEERDGSRTVITEGYESMDPSVEMHRAITGGTGALTGARGRDSTQRFLGVNDSQGVNLRVRFVDRPPPASNDLVDGCEAGADDGTQGLARIADCDEG